MSDKKLLNSAENAVLSHLEKAWNDFLDLEILHRHDLDEFLRGVHAAQLVVMARPVTRQMIDEKGRANDK